MMPGSAWRTQRSPGISLVWGLNNRKVLICQEPGKELGESDANRNSDSICPAVCDPARKGKLEGLNAGSALDDSAVGEGPAQSVKAPAVEKLEVGAVQYP